MTSIANCSYENNPNCIIVDGWRIVLPYKYTYKVNVKARWLNNPLIDALTKEFRNYPREYFYQALSEGRIWLQHRQSGKSVSCELESSDGHDTTHVFYHIARRYEPTIRYNVPLQILKETKNVLVINKPAGIPVHPTGKYKHNTVTEIARYSFGIERIFLVYRLDKFTSGLLVTAKSAQIASKLSCDIRERRTTKKYLLRVKGRFSIEKLQNQIEISKRDVLTETDENICLFHKFVSLPANTTHAEDTVGTIERTLVHGTSDFVSSNAESCLTPSNDTIFDTEMNIQKTQMDDDEYFHETISDSSENADNRTINSIYHVTVYAPILRTNAQMGVHITHPMGKSASTTFKPIKYFDEDNTTLLEAIPHTGRTHQIRLHAQFIGYPIANDPNYGGSTFLCTDNTSICSDSLKTVSSSDGEYIRTSIETAQLHCHGIWLHAWKYSCNDWAYEAPLPQWA